eukprot:scaffold1493_cov172-Ochromonas_danica.AAC.15
MTSSSSSSSARNGIIRQPSLTAQQQQQQEPSTSLPLPLPLSSPPQTTNSLSGIPLLGSLLRWYQAKRKVNPNHPHHHPHHSKSTGDGIKPPPPAAPAPAATAPPHRRLSSIEMLFNRVMYKLSRQLSSHANIAIVHPHSDDIDEGRSVGFAEEDESIAATVGGGRTVNHFFIVGTSTMEHKYVGSQSGEMMMMLQTARNSDEGGEEDDDNRRRGLDKDNQESSLRSLDQQQQQQQQLQQQLQQ